MTIQERKDAYVAEFNENEQLINENEQRIAEIKGVLQQMYVRREQLRGKVIAITEIEQAEAATAAEPSTEKAEEMRGE